MNISLLVGMLNIYKLKFKYVEDETFNKKED